MTATGPWARRFCFPEGPAEAALNKGIWVLYAQGAADAAPARRSIPHTCVTRVCARARV